MIKYLGRALTWLVDKTLGLAFVGYGVYVLIPVMCLNLECRYNQLANSVVEIEAQALADTPYGIMPANSIGSGTYIAKHYILTAEHVVVDDDDGGVLVTIDGKSVNGIVIATDFQYDVALIYTEDYEGSPVRRGTVDTIHVGDEVITVGSPAGLTGTLGVGYISAPVQEDANVERDVIQYSADNFHGNSGGGVFNQYNELLGIVSYYRAFPSFTFAISIDQLELWIDTEIAKHEDSNK